MLFDPGFRALHFAVRPRVVFHHAGRLLLAVAALSVVPAGVNAACGNLDGAVRFAIAIAIFVAIGGLGAAQRVTDHLQRNEALVITALMFSVPPIVLTIPMMGFGIGFVDALFETVSGATTTGLSVLPTVEDKPVPFLFARAWLQWIGGLGVVVLALAMLLTPGSATRSLGFSDREVDDTVGGTRAHARQVIVVYCALTLIGIALIFAAGAEPFDALVLSLAAISTGGFSNSDTSLAGSDGLGVPLAVSAVCLLGAVSFYIYYRPFYGRWRQFIEDQQTRLLLALCAVGTLIIYFVIPPGEASSPLERLSHAFVTVVSAQTTAGFSTLSMGELAPFGVLFLVVVMLIGGSIGSTSGGIKLFRFAVLVRVMLLTLMRSSTPDTAHLVLRFDRRRVEPLELQAIVAVLLGYLLTVVVSWMIFVAHDISPLPALFEVVSAVATAGNSVGVASPDLDPVLKLVLIVDMILGRVETVAVIVLLFPWTWIGRRRLAA